MNPEIEKLIDLALADGQITEKERNVVLKKAAELGIDADEVEMTLDGRLHQLDASQPKQKEKVGNIKTCPACGASVKSMDLICSECGHEYRNKMANKSLIELIKKLEKEDEKNYEYDDDRSKKKASIIKQFVIPQNNEDILEFISYCLPIFLSSGFLNDDDESKAWEIKVNQAFIKAKLGSQTIEDKNRLDSFLETYKTHSKVKNKNKSLFWIAYPFLFGGVIFIGYLMYAFIFSLFGKNHWPF
jgi:hypothetical protein